MSVAPLENAMQELVTGQCCERKRLYWVIYIGQEEKTLRLCLPYIYQEP